MKKIFQLSVLSISLGYIPLVTAHKNNQIEILPQVKHDVSKNLRDLVSAPQTKAANVTFAEEISTKNALTVRVLEGLGKGYPNYQVSAITPDTIGSVGMTQYVQWVNSDINIITKSTGKAVAGFPKPGNVVWTGFGGECEKRNVGNGIVKYDQLAGRWVLTQFAYGDVFSGPFYQCVAISQTEDASGAYDRYAFQFDSLVEKPKLGLWIDAYYMTFNMKGPFTYGPRLCALDRTKMLNNQPATMQCRQFGPSDSTVQLLPADLDGKKVPPYNTPGYFINWKEVDASTRMIQLFRFYVDFTDSFNSVLADPILIRDARASLPLNAVQPNTNFRLDTHGESFMSRLAYREFGPYGSLLATETVSDGTYYPGFVRWFEFRLNHPSSIPSLYQTSDIKPDSRYRFLGSLAMDKLRNMALAYSTSSTSIYPSIELSYRYYNDPINSLPQSQALVTGSGAQTNHSKWNTYSSMAVDPVDDCTFWYTNAYLKESGTLNWRTAIVNFKLPNCS